MTKEIVTWINEDWFYDFTPDNMGEDQIAQAIANLEAVMRERYPDRSIIICPQASLGSHLKADNITAKVKEPSDDDYQEAWDDIEAEEAEDEEEEENDEGETK